MFMIAFLYFLVFLLGWAFDTRDTVLGIEPLLVHKVHEKSVHKVATLKQVLLLQILLDIQNISEGDLDEDVCQTVRVGDH